MNYREAINQANHFRIEVDTPNGTEETTRKTMTEWLETESAFLKSRRNGSGITAVRAWAVQEDGEEIMCGGWVAIESELTPEQIKEGREAFMDDLAIKAVVG